VSWDAISVHEMVPNEPSQVTLPIGTSVGFATELPRREWNPNSGVDESLVRPYRAGDNFRGVVIGYHKGFQAFGVIQWLDVFPEGVLWAWEESQV